MSVTYRLISITTLIMLLPLSIFSQGIKGRITNEKGDPLPFATVYIKESRMGTASNLEGFYEISLPDGRFSVTYQFLGHKPVEEIVDISGKVTVKNVVLSEQVFEMPEIVVRANEKDRSYYIMRKAIGMAPWHLKQIKSYEAEVYIKGGGVINRLPRLLKKQMKASANENEIKEGKYYFNESVNIISFSSPDKYVHRVVSSRSNMPVNDASASPMDFIEASFYQPVIADIAISPLAPNAFSHYNFRFLGSTRQGTNTISKIQVIPKRKSQQLFSGTIFIVENEWAIQSLDLVNENMAGIIKIKQLYLPVEGNIWMPVNHDFKIDVSIMGIKAEASYVSSVKYTRVEPDKDLPTPSGMIASNNPSTDIVKDPINQNDLDEIEDILSRDKISTRDMARLSRLNEKISQPEEKESLEIKETTTYIIDKDATQKDSAYWERARPIPLSENERVSIPVKAPSDTTLRRSNTVTISVGVNGSDKKKSGNFTKASRAIINGRRWEVNKNNSLSFDGLISLKTFSFNTVDGFTAGTGLTWTLKTGEFSKLDFNPSIRYAFNRQDLMWSINSGFNWDPIHRSWIIIRAGSMSQDFAQSGINPFINSLSSLLFRYNFMKLFKNDFITMSYKTEITNGLTARLSAGFQNRSVLENSTDFSIFRPDREYTLNIPDNDFIRGDVPGFSSFTPVNHRNVFISGELSYTFRQFYKMQNSVKVNMHSESPVMTLSWKHGYNYNDTLSAHYDYLGAGVRMNRSLGAMRHIEWDLGTGGYINARNLQFQDMKIFNAQESPVLINNYSDALFLKRHYEIATPTFFTEAHIKYTTPCLLIKRMPVLSRTLMRENVSMAYLYTPQYKNYTEFGYSVSEIFFLGEAGIYAGFRDLKFDGLGFKIILRIK